MRSLRAVIVGADVSEPLLGARAQARCAHSHGRRSGRSPAGSALILILILIALHGLLHFIKID